jgi:hypothetical protein
VLAAGDATRIETTDGRSTPLVSGNPQLESLLEFLALLDDGAEQINPATPSGTGTVVAVSADPILASDAAARRRFAVRLRAAIVITLDADVWGSAASGPISTGEWIHLTGPGQLAGHWQLGRPASTPRTP